MLDERMNFCFLFFLNEKEEFLSSISYGGTEFSSRGIQLAVDLFRSYGYPDTKITVIIPNHFLSKDKDKVFNDLIRRKIVHTCWHQKAGDETKRFYDDR